MEHVTRQSLWTIVTVLLSIVAGGQSPNASFAEPVITGGTETIVPDTVIAVIERSVITQRDFDYWIFESRLMRPETREVTDAELIRDMLTEVVDEKLLADWAEFLLEPPDEEPITTRLRTAWGRYERAAGGRQQLLDQLEDNKLDADGFRRWARDQARRSFMIREALESIADLSGANPADSPLSEAVRLKLAHIVVLPRGTSPEADAIALKRVLEVRRDIQAGLPFAEAARLYSDDKPTAEQGGELGWLQEREVMEELWSAALGSQRGQSSSPVRTRLGYHLLLVLDYETQAQLDYFTRLRKAEARQLLKLREDNDIQVAKGYQLLDVPTHELEPMMDFWEELEAGIIQRELRKKE